MAKKQIKREKKVAQVKLNSTRSIESSVFHSHNNTNNTEKHKIQFLNHITHTFKKLSANKL